MPLSPLQNSSASGNPSRESNLLKLQQEVSYSDSDLVDRAVRGDAWAEEAIYRRYVQYVASIVARLLQNQSETEDVLQDTFVLAFENIGGLRDGASLRFWLARIAIRLAKQRLRREKLLRLIGRAREMQRDVAQGEGRAEATTELTLLDEVLQSLPVNQRIVWVLHRVNGETIEEVSSICECSPATAKRRLAAVEAAIREHFDAEGLS